MSTEGTAANEIREYVERKTRETQEHTRYKACEARGYLEHETRDGLPTLTPYITPYY